MFTVTGEHFYKFLECVQTISRTALLTFEKDLLEVSTLSPCRSAFLYGTMKGEGNLEITDGYGIDVKPVLDFVKKFRKETITIDHKKGMYIFNSSKVKKFFPAKAMDTQEKPPTTPWDISAVIDCDLAKYISSSGRDMRLNAKDGKLYASSVSAIDDMTKTEGEIGTAKKEGKCIYSAEYFKDICSAVGKELKIEFGEELPARMLYENDEMNVLFLLAPKVFE